MNSDFMFQSEYEHYWANRPDPVAIWLGRILFWVLCLDMVGLAFLVGPRPW